ncbi:MAG: fluoride efflux transporter CrcB [Fidelibacterota bacterium]
MIEKFLLVGSGGFIGAIVRYLASGLIHRWIDRPFFPLGTLFVNISACFIIGIIGGLMEYRQLFHPELRLFLLIGFLGSYSTFSTFGFEVFTFARDGQILSALLNTGLHLFLGLTAVWLGVLVSKLIWGA